VRWFHHPAARGRALQNFSFREAFSKP
jgi:hypothetical protein